jgi:hypothetical protein
MGRDLSVFLLLSAIFVDVSCSANFLTYVGVPYVTDGGSFFFKIHPGSYLLYSAFVLAWTGAPWTAGRVSLCLYREKLIITYIGAICFCLAYALLLTGRSNLIVMLDTFLPAGMAAAICAGASPDRCLSIRRLLQIGIFLNAIIALAEESVHANLIPLYLDQASYKPPEQEFRPTALFDHPLTGGMVTMIGLALVPVRGLVRPVYMFVLVAALIAFGGRVAVAMSLFSVAASQGVFLGRSLLRRESRAAVTLAGWTALAFVVFALLLLGVALGFGQRFAGHLYWDASAQVRLSQWGVLGELDTSELLFGARREELIAVLTPLWLTDGVEVIENFWLLMFVNLGAPGFLVFIVGFGALLLHFWEQSTMRGQILLISTILAASTSNSLGRKSTLLVILVAAMTNFSKLAATRDRSVYLEIRPMPVGV